MPVRILLVITVTVHDNQFDCTKFLKIAPLLGAKNVFLYRIGIKYNFIVIKNLRWLNFGIMKVRRNVQHIFKCGIDGWHILSLVECRFVGATNLIRNIDVAETVADLVEY